ncbi:MAG: NUDIX domain-containing protein [Chlamydiae bacterium]|nr:NUDIX domain-containing protein [Chlamydiota bacterium]
MIKDASFGIVPISKMNQEWQVLLIYHRNGNHWGFPKGHKEGRESDFQAACRELFEETGLHVLTCLCDQPYVERFHFSRFGKKIEKTVSYFPAMVSGRISIQLEEIREATWFNFDQAIERLTFEEARSICRHVRGLVDAKSGTEAV